MKGLPTLYNHSEAGRAWLEGTWVDSEPPADLQWLAIDLDGTLAQGIWTPDNPTSKIGLPRWENVEKALEADRAGYKITIHTARGWTDYMNIERWLNHFEIPFRRIVCGKILAKLYIDDRGRHDSAESWVP